VGGRPEPFVRMKGLGFDRERAKGSIDMAGVRVKLLEILKWLVPIRG
jgi:hypothetical protein